MTFYGEPIPQLVELSKATNPQLATALYITHAFEAPLKAPLLILALFGLLSTNASARTALFVSMSLVPPINIAFHFRARGFPLSSMTIATILSTILWVSFLLIREPAQQAERSETTGPWEIFRSAWFALSARSEEHTSELQSQR